MGVLPPCLGAIKAEVMLAREIHHRLIRLQQLHERNAMVESLLTATASVPVSFAARSANSAAFDALLRDGMALVEETAIYLDGPGREEAKKLGRKSALAYSAESIRLTTRLMQLAAWLVLYRAVKTGEISIGEASRERAKVKLSTIDEANDLKNYELLPVKLRTLIGASRLLHARVRRMDVTLHHCTNANGSAPLNPVGRQLELLKAAFAENA
jgi:regulator of CtrA degradation